MKKVLKPAFIDTIPVLTGYLALGFGFGIILKANGYGLLLAFVMSLTIYSGSMQYIAVGLLSENMSLLSVALTTIMVNARYMFYGISVLDKYRGAGIRKPYLIFTITDETYSLVCRDNPSIPPERKKDYYLLVSLFDHIYWIAGCMLGALIGSFVKFNSEGIDFVLTALFLTIFIEQWLTSKKHASAIIGVAVSVACLFIFDSQNFLIPTMLIIALILCLFKEGEKNG